MCYNFLFFVAGFYFMNKIDIKRIFLWSNHFIKAISQLNTVLQFYRILFTVLHCFTVYLEQLRGVVRHDTERGKSL